MARRERVAAEREARRTERERLKAERAAERAGKVPKRARGTSDWSVKFHSDPEFREKERARLKAKRARRGGKIGCHMRAALRRPDPKRKTALESKLGYRIADLRIHIERQFTRGMSWDRFDEIQLDHVLPRAMFGDDELEAWWAMTNLRPIWAKQNLVKGPKRLTLL